MGNAEYYTMINAMIKTAHVVSAESHEGSYDALGMQL
jgi:hypothetical protein